MKKVIIRLIVFISLKASVYILKIKLFKSSKDFKKFEIDSGFCFNKNILSNKLDRFDSIDEINIKR